MKTEFIKHPNIPDVISVRAGEAYLLSLEFSDGTKKSFDFSPYLEWPCYKSLLDPAAFAKATVQYGTVVWPGNIDIDPEILYLK